MKTLLKSFNIPNKILTIVGGIILLIVIILAGLIAYQSFGKSGIVPEDNLDRNIYVEFLSEIYEKIQENYWEKISDEKLFKLYKLGAEKLEHKPGVIITNDKTGMRSLVNSIINELANEKEKREFTINLATIVMYNLQPLGRSGLYTVKKETELWDNVKNIDPSINLYDEIEVDENATEDQIAQAVKQKTAELKQILQDTTKSDEEKQTAQNKLAKVGRVQETLTQPEARKTYDQSGVEATVYATIIKPNILHMRIKRMSPTSFNELQQVANDFDQYDDLDTLILDLRGNIGGSIDLMPYFLGPFIGPNQYAYETYRQGEYEPVKTKVGWLAGLVRYKRVVILQDEIGQSSAEIMASVLKKYNVGVLVGTTSMGWGTIEAVFNIDNQIDPNETYKMFLVHSVTIREDGQPIQDRGIDPLININDDNWTDQLYKYFKDWTLIREVEKILKNE